jgi:cell division transport system permease protein
MGLLAAQQVDRMKDRWYDQIEISVFLCTKDTRGDNCDRGLDATDAQKSAIRTAIEGNPEVQQVYYESKQEAFEEFQKAYEGTPMQESLTVDQMQDSYRVKLKDPAKYAGLVSEVRGLKGVQSVQDLHTYLDPIFAWLNALRWGTIAMSVLLLLAAALQIAAPSAWPPLRAAPRVGDHAARGSQQPLHHVAVPAGVAVRRLIGAGLACASLAAFTRFVIIDRAQVSLKALRWIGWSETSWAMAGVVMVASCCHRADAVRDTSLREGVEGSDGRRVQTGRRRVVLAVATAWLPPPEPTT